MNYRTILGLAAALLLVPAAFAAMVRLWPRTFIGRSSTGSVLLVTIDGRRPSSVGTTLKETADVALALDMRDAINLDGGDSTTMVAAGEMVSTPSGPDERAVGDALVFVPAS